MEQGARLDATAVRAPDATGVLAGVRGHWPLWAVVGAFVASAFVVPTLAPVAISDDWVYIRSVEKLVQDGRFWVSPIATANLVFQIVWGALFALAFGPSLGVIRLSAVVLWLLGGIACYGLVWELTRQRGLSALGAAMFLFNPLGYALAFTFMTDAPFAALLVATVYAFVRALREPHTERWLAVGGVLTAAAVLTRQPGVLIPPAVLLALLVTRRLPVSLLGLQRALLVGGPPLFAYGVYWLWVTRVNGVPVTQTLMQDSLLQGGWSALWLHAEQLSIIEALYAGLFLLPAVAAALPALWIAVRTMRVRGWAAVAVWVTFLVIGVIELRATNHRMPLIPHFLSKAGLGPNDLLIARPPLAPREVFDAITFVCAGAALVAGILVIHAFDQSRQRAGAVLVLSVLAWQAVGALIVSTYFRFWMIDGVSAPSLDRYLLPLLPLVIALGLWSLRDLRISPVLGGAVALVLALFAVAGTRDNVAFHAATWELARIANADGVSNLKLDAGAAWVGYYMGEYSYETKGVGPRDDPRWWMSLFGRAVDPEYTITTAPERGYTVVREYPWRAWLQRDARLYLLHRDPAPPRP